MLDAPKPSIGVSSLDRVRAGPESQLRLLAAQLAIAGSGVPRRIEAVGERFYRPELDAVRFFAFFAVLLHHGPDGRNLLSLCRAAGDFGLSMFFLLSGYLITELLVREREQTGKVSWRLFFVRRALRIWPLYYAALAIALMIALTPPHHYWVSPIGLATMSVFISNWFQIGPQLGVLIGHLWSISVEEQFYLIWAPIIKFGGRGLALLMSVAFIVAAGSWLFAFSGKGWTLWFDTPVEFLFFAAGATIALAIRGEPPQWMNCARGALRGIFLVIGPGLLLIASGIGGAGIAEAPGLTITRLSIGYGGGLVGCSMIFLAMLGMRNIPKPLTYLGKISYGLYVVHLAMLELAMWLVSPLKLAAYSTARVFAVDGLALALCVCAAHLSYRYFEVRFLKLKEQFSVIKSRPV